MSCFSCFTEIFPCCPASVFSVKKKKKSSVAKKYEAQPSNDQNGAIQDGGDEDVIRPSEVVTVESSPYLSQRTPAYGEDEIDGSFEEKFREEIGEDGEVDAYELREILNKTFNTGFQFDGFNADVCRSMVAMRDMDMSGKLGLDECKDLWAFLHSWQNSFINIDTDQNGYIDADTFASLLNHQDIQLNENTVALLSKRYSDRERKMWFPDFIYCMVKIKSATELFEGKPKDDNNQMELELDEFIQVSMYT